MLSGFRLLSLANIWQTLVDHWGIALAMAIGSYAAGSTPMGGGTVGFPVLVLLFGEADLRWDETLASRFRASA